MSILPPLGAFFCPRKAKMKKKTLYNIIMLVVIGLIAAGAVFFAGRHLGWFDGADAAVSAQVHKGLATLTRDGIASELTGETALRTGDVLTVTSGSTAVQAGGSTLTLSQGSKLQVESAGKSAPRLRLTEGGGLLPGSGQRRDAPVGRTGLAAARCGAGMHRAQRIGGAVRAGGPGHGWRRHLGRREGRSLYGREILGDRR